MATNILGSLMSSAQGYASSAMATSRKSKSDGEQKDPMQAILKSKMDEAQKFAQETGDSSMLERLGPEAQKHGLDPSIWMAAAGFRTPEQKATADFNAQLAEIINRVSASGTSNPPPSSANPRTSVFDESTLLRMAAKKYSGIDIGQNYLENDQWYRDFGTLRENGVPVSDAVNQLATTYGFVPEDASNLKDLSTEERQTIFSKSFGNMMDDPDIGGTLAQVYPNAVDRQTGQLDPKVKAGVVLNYLSKQGMLIPERYQPFLDRFRGLSTPENVVGKDEAQWLYATKGILPDAASPDDLAQARKVIANENIINATKQAAATERARTGVQYEMEPTKPISAEDRAKFGVGSTIKTYQQLADEGYRFPTEYDRKQYDTFSATRTDMLAMESMLFGKGGISKPSKEGIFTGIGNNLAERKTSQLVIMKDMATGNSRGQNYEMYNDALAAMARRLLALAGESGGRFTDRDVAQLIRAAPDVGGLFGAPDSQAVAQDKYERFIVKLNKALSDLEQNTVIKPTGAPATSTPTRRQDPDGNWWNYTEESGWQMEQKK